MTIADGGFTWNLVEDVRRLLEFHFMVNAFRAGTIVAVVAAVIGWFMVLRRQTFAGHTLSIVAFPGAAAATLVGVSALFGYFTFCIVAAVVIAAVPRTGGRGFSEESAVVGTVQAFALACGFLFVTLYGGLLDSVNSLLFGSFLGITDTQVATLFAVGIVALVAIAIIGRPLLFASLDPDVASAHGVPVRTLSVVFLVVLGVAVAEASQITGALLVFALLVLPAATAQVLTARPLVGLATSVAIGVGVTWLGLACSYFSDQPIGFFVTTFAFAAYVLAHGGRWAVRRFQARSGGGGVRSVDLRGAQP
jgi:zinc/manganese transport system permease protein